MTHKPITDHNHRPATLIPAEEKMTTMNVVVSAAVDLTQRQRDIIEFIAAFAKEHGYCPSVREIGEAVGMASTSSVHYQLTKLDRLGVLARVPNRSRTTLVAAVELPAA
jgi:repressor LexA